MSRWLKVIAALLCATALLWAVVSRFFFAITPPWLDIATAIAAGLAILIFWLLAKANPDA
jgi:cytosine/uracil/thiamine/allantoin permease